MSAENPAEAAEAAEAATAVALSQRRTRILSIDGKRRIFALELPLWAALERMAARKGKRLNVLIGTLLTTSNTESQTSHLRAAAVTWLLGECDLLREQIQASMRGILSAIPAPAVAMTADQQVIAQNSAFARLATETAAEAGEPGSGPEVTLRLDVAPARLIALLTADSHRAVGAPFTLRTARRKRSGIMNTAIVQTGGTPLLLCVVRKLSDEP